MTNPGRDPRHHYVQAGNHTVTLTGTHITGPFSTYSQTAVVHPLPVPSFTHSGPACLNQTLAFTDTSTGATAYDWDFGDGIGTSTAQNPTYAYTATGAYSVTLAVTSTYGCSNAYAKTVNVTTCRAYIYLPVILRNQP